jgi:hypothetical protein
MIVTSACATSRHSAQRHCRAVLFNHLLEIKRGLPVRAILNAREMYIEANGEEDRD